MRFRRARPDDSKAVISLIARFAAKNLMLPVSKDFLFEHINDYFVAEDKNRLVGVVFLRIYSEKLAEIRSLAVDPKIRRRGVGRSLVEHCLTEARSLQLPKVFALTYQAEFFRRIGFERVDKGDLPHKVWRDCLKCTKFPHCDETAVLRVL